ncbi:TKL/TKL-CCIN protein Kinase [Phytophthora palmivora]|uniref:TKL/TKL-CCIN protein Kinase n=1 Tax=Phytophthora palmivora TaxID=4796 RepID=A0A2P4Y609_9STRA|nr:TKL/TKL-CCIN protein Kinase [Phytophthora palmivora]
MSFLSPKDFPVESTSPLVTVKVSRNRLYLTLGVQGTLIAVTSFVQDEFGRPGEVEQSGKVFLGDVLVRINDNYITPGMTPGHVAAIVNSAIRPMTLWFERASWDVLDGKA